MRAVFVRPTAKDEPVATATWTGPGVAYEARDEPVREALGRIFRRTPVLVDDPAFRTAGTAGPVALTPGTLAWFMVAARTRSETEGLQVVFSPSGAGAVGWDPAGAYRPFHQQVERIERERDSSPAR